MTYVGSTPLPSHFATARRLITKPVSALQEAVLPLARIGAKHEFQLAVPSRPAMKLHVRVQHARVTVACAYRKVHPDTHHR
jgi:hypothetical protein